MSRHSRTALLAIAAAVLSTAALAQEATTTRIETRAFYGATVTLEAGVRVFRPLPPHSKVIINPGGVTPLHIGLQENRDSTRSSSSDQSGNDRGSSFDNGFGSFGGGFGGLPFRNNRTFDRRRVDGSGLRPRPTAGRPLSNARAVSSRPAPAAGGGRR